MNVAAAVAAVGVVTKTTEMRAWTKRSVALVAPTVAATKATVVDATVHVVLVATSVVLAASADSDSQLQRTSSSLVPAAVGVVLAAAVEKTKI